MAKNMTGKIETIERTVIQLRKRFDSLMIKCGGGDRLAKRLSKIDGYFGTIEGYESVRNAKRGVAGEEPMIRIIAAMEKLSEQKLLPSSKAERSLVKMGIVYEPKYATTKALQKKMQASKNN